MFDERKDVHPNTVFEVHEAAAIFPPMSEAEFQQLKSDIQQHGLREPIWIYSGKVIDGRHRLRACTELGIQPPTREWDGNGSLLSFVISMNLHRRHLDESQRAMVAARLLPEFERERQSAAGAGCQDGAGANLREGRPSEAVAEMMNVSPRSVESANRLLNEGLPELISAVDSGTVAVSAAAEVAELPHEEQKAVVEKGESEIKRIAKVIRQAKSKKQRGRKKQKAHPAKAGGPLFGSAPEIRDDGAWFCLEVSNEWQNQIAALMSDTSKFEMAIAKGLLITKRKPEMQSKQRVEGV